MKLELRLLHHPLHITGNMLKMRSFFAHFRHPLAAIIFWCWQSWKGLHNPHNPINNILNPHRSGNQSHHHYFLFTLCLAVLAGVAYFEGSLTMLSILFLFGRVAYQ